MLNILLCILVSLVILVVALRFKKAALILLGILIVVGSVFGIIVWQSGKPKESRNVQKSRPSHTLSAKDLMSHYERDAYGADLNYGDKVIALTGDINTIYKEEFDKYPNQFRHVIWLRAGRLSASSSKQSRGKTNNPFDDIDMRPPVVESNSKQGRGKVDPFRRLTPQRRESSSKQDRGKVEQVKCDFNRSEAYSLRNLKVGDTIKIKGRVSKSNAWDSTSGLRRDIYSDTLEPFLYITLEDCVLVK